ncbi:MAG: hypothetical protein ACREV2_16950, partial [Burkholderiales bacterium]
PGAVAAPTAGLHFDQVLLVVSTIKRTKVIEGRARADRLIKLSVPLSGPIAPSAISDKTVYSQIVADHSGSLQPERRFAAIEGRR